MTDTLILENQSLIYAIIHKYYSNYPNKNDLFQAGCLGLIKASKKYNDTFDTKFSSYAYKYILGEISEFLRKDKGLKISHDLQKLYYRVEKVKLLLYQKYMREPTIIELADYLEMDEEKVKEILSIPMHIESLDEPYNNGENDLNLYEVIAGKSYNIDELMALKDELIKLDDNEKKLIVARYQNDMTQNEVAKLLNMSQVGVSRYEKKVLMKLKNRLQG